MAPPNGLPRSIVPAGRTVAVPEDAIQRYRAEMMQKVQDYLNELGKHESVRNEAFNILLIEAVRGLPWLPGETIEQRCARLSNADLEAIDGVAGRVADLKLRRNFSRAKALLAELNVDDLPDFVVWSARQVGVNLVSASDTVVEQVAGIAPASS